MELLLPMAAMKLDLSFNIETDVPPCEFICHFYKLLILTHLRIRGQSRLCAHSPRLAHVLNRYRIG